MMVGRGDGWPRDVRGVGAAGAARRGRPSGSPLRDYGMGTTATIARTAVAAPITFCSNTFCTTYNAT
jgi:hypothetical protein